MIRLTIAPDLELVSWVGASVRGLCQYWGLDELPTYHVELCVVEAATNSVAHAPPQSEEEIEVRLARDRGALRIAIIDHGSPLPEDLLERYRTTAAPSRDNLGELLERGRGLNLIQELMTEVEFERVANRNVLKFCYPLGDS